MSAVALVHAYLWAMVAALWLADFIARPKPRRMTEPVLIAGVSLVSIWLCGYFVLAARPRRLILETGKDAMFERALNAFWILLGAAAAAYAWTLGLIGASGPESGLFPFLAGLIIMGAGVVLLLRPLSEHIAPDFPRGDALWRVLGVIAGLAFMAISIPFLGFAVAGFITMVILLHTVEKSSWWFSLALALVAIVVVVWLFGRILGMALPRGPWGW